LSVEGVEVKVTTAEPLHAARNAIAAVIHGTMIQRLMERRDAEPKPELRSTIEGPLLAYDHCSGNRGAIKAQLGQSSVKC